MPKGTLIQDTFEQLAELGQSTARKTVKQLGRTLNPLSFLTDSSPDTAKSLENKQQQNQNIKKEGSEIKKNQNSTPIDLDKLGKKFQDQEKLKEQALRQRLFQMIRQSDEKLFNEYKKKEIEKRKMEEWEKQQKEKKKKEEQARQQESLIPRGRIRRSIFSPKKIAQRQHLETKASFGKQ